MFALLSYICEAFVLIYLGLSFDTFTFDRKLVIYAYTDFFVLIITRIIMVFGLTYITKIFMKDKSKCITFSETLLITAAGCIRGAIAYVLVVNIANGDVM